MAPFNKPLPASNPDITIGYSRGRDSQRFAQDNSLENLFTGLAKGAGAAIQMADKTIQGEIRRDITQSVDDIRAGFTDPNITVSQATGLPADPDNPTNPPLPAELEQARNKLTTLRAAVDQRKISETSYYSQILAETKRIRAKWPGYREQIDDITRSVVGTDPANAIVRKVFQEANEREDRAYAQAVRNENDLRDLQERGLATGFEINQVRTGQKPMTWIYARVGEREEKVRFAENERKMMNISNEFLSRDVGTLYIINSHRIMKDVLKNHGIENSPDLTSFMVKVAANGQVTPALKKTMTVIAHEILAAQRAELNRLKTTYPQLPASTWSGLEAQVNAREEVYSKAMGADRLPSVLALDAIEQEDLNNQSLTRLQEKMSTKARTAFALQKKFPEAADTIIRQFTDRVKIEGEMKAAFDAATGTVIDKTSLPQSLEEFDRKASVNNAPGASRNQTKLTIIDGAVQSVAEADAPEASQIVRAIFPKEGRAFSGINQNSWKMYYNRVTSPKNIEVLRPKFATDKAAAKEYAEGVKRHWSVLYKQQLDTIQQAAEADPTFRVLVDENGNLDFTSAERERTNTGTNPLNPDVNFFDVRAAIDELNTTWANTQNALKSTGLVDTEGKELSFSLTDQVITLGNGRLYDQLRDQRGENEVSGPTTFSGVEFTGDPKEISEALAKNIQSVLRRFPEEMEAMGTALDNTFGESYRQVRDLLVQARNLASGQESTAIQSPPTTASGLTAQEARRKAGEPTPSESRVPSFQSTSTSPPKTFADIQVPEEVRVRAREGLEDVRRFIESLPDPTAPLTPEQRGAGWTSGDQKVLKKSLDKVLKFIGEFDPTAPLPKDLLAYPNVSNFGGRGVVADLMKEAYQQLPQRTPVKEFIENFLADYFMMEEGELPTEGERENIRDWLNKERSSTRLPQGATGDFSTGATGDIPEDGGVATSQSPFNIIQGLLPE